ncbi:16S rRNA (guanine(527)-N(7))-methyltransferase RsmG [Jannaschia rubra]|uniref:16S rRNA (guanine(527)-N(7))-methyltransferase RsmG n=1 Tax=Jannaschia rubra TaxID=282197 RepID=UPI000943D3AB|nr:16S rRNA (guanine(527)-N(7))-methyltransferase RsmG [Jannaschia rubra]
MIVSRETETAFVKLGRLVRKWNGSINIVSRETLDALERRHIADSVAVYATGPGGGSWLDLGSGGGFPGVVVAILAGGRHPVTLIESDKRKCEFLRTVRRELNLNFDIVNKRIEETIPIEASVISARALAPLPKLLSLAIRHANDGTVFLFPKGANWQAEDVAARREWTYDLEQLDSLIQPGSVILRIRNVRRA